MNADKHLVFIGVNRCSSAAICSSHVLSERLPSCAGSRRLRLFAKCGDPVLQRPQANPQHLGSALAITAHVLQGEFDVSLVDFHERLARLKHHSTIQVRRLPGRAAGTYPEGGGRKIRQPDKTLASPAPSSALYSAPVRGGGSVPPATPKPLSPAPAADSVPRNPARRLRCRCPPAASRRRSPWPPIRAPATSRCVACRACPRSSQKSRRPCGSTRSRSCAR